MGMVAEPGSPKHTMLGAVPTTTSPGIGACRGGMVRTGAKLTLTPWESRWPQTVGKLQTRDVLLSRCLSACPELILFVLTVYHLMLWFPWMRFLKWRKSSKSFAQGFCSTYSMELTPLPVFPLCVTSSHFISISLSPPLSNQVLGEGRRDNVCWSLICHMGPWSCNQNSFWPNLCAPFEHAQSYAHT